MKGTGKVGLELSVTLIQTVETFDMSVSLYTGILTLEKMKYFMSKDLSTKTLLFSCTAANDTRTHPEHETKNIICHG